MVVLSPTGLSGAMNGHREEPGQKQYWPAAFISCPKLLILSLLMLSTMYNSQQNCHKDSTTDINARELVCSHDFLFICPFWSSKETHFCQQLVLRSQKLLCFGFQHWKQSYNGSCCHQPPLGHRWGFQEEVWKEGLHSSTKWWDIYSIKQNLNCVF